MGIDRPLTIDRCNKEGSPGTVGLAGVLLVQPLLARVCAARYLLALWPVRQVQPAGSRACSTGPFALAGELLKTTLERHPRLLAYDAPASAGGPLASGGARASVALVDAPAGKAVSVSLWREGASFLTSPVSPWRPAES